MEIREFEIRAVDPELREVSGVAVPYGDVVEIGGFKESFQRGAFGDGSTDVPLFYGHDHRQGGMPIGRVVESRDSDEGLLIRARISKTVKGDEVYQLLRDGVLNKFSVGFEPKAHRMDGDVVVRTEARLREVSIVPHPAYEGASVAEVRDNDSAISTNRGESPVAEEISTNNEVAELRENVADLERRMASMAYAAPTAPAEPQFRSVAEVMKALAGVDLSGNRVSADRVEEARMLLRAADGTAPATGSQAGTGFDTGGNWLARRLNFTVDGKRRMVDAFNREPLPDFGLSVEYPKVGSTNGTVAVQSAEGDTLNYMEVELSQGTASVGTYGGYSRLSRQAIERGLPSYLEGVLRFQALHYAKVTEGVVRTALISALSSAPTGGGLTLATAKAADWIGAVIDGCASIEANSAGLVGDFIVVSSDVFKSIMTIDDTTDRPVFAVAPGGMNVAGSGDIVRPAFNIGGLPGLVDPNLSANTAFVASREAITTLESAGAPFRLQDESVVALTKDFSLYGYLAVTENDTNGLFKIVNS